MARRPTMQDVADRAGVSKTTVSHVINQTRFVEEETRQRVQAVIEELGYRPSLVARSLTTQRNWTIGIIISDVTNIFFGEILLGIDEILRPAKYSLIVCNTNEILEREEEYLGMLMHQRVDGIIAAATSRPWEVLTEAELQDTPIVLLDREFAESPWPFVGVNNEQGAYLGTKHLLDCGHHRIALLVGHQRLSTIRDRLHGFQRAMAEHQIAVPEEWIIPSELRVDAAREATLKLLTSDGRPTAIFANNNLLTLGALEAIHDLGLRCPEDIGLIGFDDHPWAAVSNPPLTVVRQPTRELGQRAAQLLLDLVNGQTPIQTRFVLDCELVERKSCCRRF